MRAFRQGNLDRFCSVYSVLNSMQLLGVHLPHNKAQAMYDYIIDQLNFYNSFLTLQKMELITNALNK